MNLSPEIRELVEIGGGGLRLTRTTRAAPQETTAVVNLPYGCPQWGDPKGVRNGLCTFCPLPQLASDYRKEFFPQHSHLAPDDRHWTGVHIDLFAQTLRALAAEADNALHTVMIFNAGSFLEMSRYVQENILQEVVTYRSVRRIVIESRARLVTYENLKPLTEHLDQHGIQLTVRIGVETQNDVLRLKVLRKGHRRAELRSAMQVMNSLGVIAGGYALLKPAPSQALREIMGQPEATEDAVNRWAVREAKRTVDWILGDGSDGLGMQEVYFCSTNVGAKTKLEESWLLGEFYPASLWMVFDVLIYALRIQQYDADRVHLLPFNEFRIVSSNHHKRGIPADLSGAGGCDKTFHEMFSSYSTTMNAAVLEPPECTCRPSWL